MKLLLKVGPDSPQGASEELMGALSAVEVTRTTSAPSGFQLSFATSRYDLDDPSSVNEWPLLKDENLQPWSRVQVEVQNGSSTTVLMDGFITRQEINLDHEKGAKIVVTGEDVSLKMDLFEVSAEYEQKKTSEIVTSILGKYSSAGITEKTVTAPQNEIAPVDYVPQQNCTDRFFVQQLAARHAFDFYVVPGSSAGSNKAFWGPPETSGAAQATLIANKGVHDNVLSLTLSYDALAATLAYGQVLDLTKNPAEPGNIAIGSATQKPDLSTGGAIPSTPSGSSLAATPTSYSQSLDKLAVHGRLALYPGFPLAEATQFAQGKTNRSVAEVVRIEGEVDSDILGEVLSAPGIVELEGLGAMYSGNYYVKEVTHNFRFESENWNYRQNFILTRGGLGLKG